MTTLRAPFPYFGGKSRIAALVWERLGDVPNYIEPFFGSGAVLLARPHEPKTETVNDKDGFVANFYRSLQHDPEKVARWADYPVNEVDLHARHRWLRDQRPIVEELLQDPEAYDAKIAGWWVWGISQWIGSGWCPPPGVSEVRKLCHLGDAGRGVHRAARPSPETHKKRPHLISNKGVQSSRDSGRLAEQMPRLSADGQGIHTVSAQAGIYTYFEALAARLRRVRVCCGDWKRITGPSVTWRHGVTGVFLDPPYSLNERKDGLYAHDSEVSAEVRTWAIENGSNPLLRIALCGYEGEHEMPADWIAVRWKAAGGYGSQGEQRGRENAHRETIWFSPHCLDLNALPMFAYLEEQAL